MNKKVLSREEIYKREVAEMQSQNHQLLIRIKELNMEVENLKKQLQELMNSHVPLR